MAQNGPPKDFQFEVLSIRPVDVASPYGTARFGAMNPDPNGFRSVLSVMQMVMFSYVSADSGAWGSVKVLNLPAWQGQFYDIAAKVSQADLTAWQHQGPEQKLLRAAMRTALRERFKLAIHEQPSKGDVFELVVAKGGARLKPTDPADDPRPPVRIETNLRGVGVIVHTVNGRQVKAYYIDLPGGGVSVAPTTVQIGQGAEEVSTYYNATMKDLAYFLNRVAAGQIPVRDKTGLTGRYDFTIKKVPTDPDENHVYSYPLKHLGLAVKPGTEQRPALVIDHIERPSPN